MLESMAIKLTNELARALDEQGEVPLQAIHPLTGKVFFLVSEDHYQRLKPPF